MIEAARMLAEKAVKAGNDDGARLTFITRRALSRTLAGKELEIVHRIKAALLTYYRSKPEDARALIAVGESKPDPALDPSDLAAWTMVCNQLLNLDETLNK